MRLNYLFYSYWSRPLNRIMTVHVVRVVRCVIPSEEIQCITNNGVSYDEPMRWYLNRMILTKNCLQIDGICGRRRCPSRRKFDVERKNKNRFANERVNGIQTHNETFDQAEWIQTQVAHVSLMNWSNRPLAGILTTVPLKRTHACVLNRPRSAMSGVRKSCANARLQPNRRNLGTRDDKGSTGYIVAMRVCLFTNIWHNNCHGFVFFGYKSNTP